jgi:hypothetical protein
LAARIRRNRDGTFSLKLPDVERDLLRSLLPQLRDLLVTDDDLTVRLFPPAYANDPERNAEYVEMVRDELLEKRLGVLDIVEETLDATNVDEDQLSGWMGAVNDMRLVLGTRLDISEEATGVADDHPDAALYAVYDYLTHLVATIVDALAGW